MSLETASSPEKAALSSFNAVSSSDGLAAHDHQRNDESPVSIGMPQSNGQNAVAHNHSGTSRILPVPDWETMVSTIQQLQDIESRICGPESKAGKKLLRDIIQTSNDLVPALKQLETTYNQRNDSLKELQGQYQQAASQVAGTSKSSDSRIQELVELNGKLEKRVKDLEVECAGLEARQEVMKIDEAQALNDLQEANRALKAVRNDDSTERRNDEPPAAQCTPNTSRPSQSKRHPSAVTAPRAKRSRISEPTSLPGQESEAEFGVALSIEKVGEPTFAKEPIPMTIWDKVRKQMVIWDHKRPQWRTQKDRAVCANAYVRKRTAEFAFGMEYSCLYCREKGNVCILVCDGEMDLLPVKDSGVTDAGSVEYWKTPEL